MRFEKSDWKLSRKLSTGKYKTYHFEKNFTCEIEYSNDATLEIKEEVIDVSDHGTAGQQVHKKYESNCCTFGTNKTDNLAINNKLPIHKQQEIQRSEEEPEKKYKCEKCARSYKRKETLGRHKKYECDVMPQFSCKFCGKRFKQKSHMTRHVRYTHLKPNESSKSRHNCDECSRSYNWSYDLTRHKLLKHATVEPQFTCDICGHKMMEKRKLSKHITSHLMQ
ncbi:putative zinc finger protein 66 [Belonocnema kinseyi]|uniref:putative zinc finger protein 66 n=1 Tax=Belonocnema kinseyi TaxID=2817044 RepID=UPI00143D4CF9|nr:putative zinc finger protein 66 [Belonocnema kinseyi]